MAFGAGVRSVFEFHLVGYRRTWTASALTSFVLPLLTVLGFGVGVGAYVSGGVGGVPYLDWIVPGLLASTAVQAAVGEATWPVLSRFAWTRTYFAQAAAPLRVADILGGQLAFSLFRIVQTALAFLLVMAAFGALHSWWALSTPAVAALAGLAVAAPVTAYSAWVTTDSYLAVLLRFAVVPMSLFSGVFFPVESLPAVLRAVAYALPLWHAADLCRAATLGVAPGWSLAGQLGYLALWVVAGWFLALHRFRRRLIF